MPRMNPEPKRVITLNSIRYALSPEQFEMLTKRSFKHSEISTWDDRQRMRGLVLKELFRETKSSYTRTQLGRIVLDALLARDNY